MAKTTVGPAGQFVSLEKSNVLRPAFLEIDLEAFAANFARIKKLAGDGVSIMAVVKANAYGHGAVDIARCAQECGADFLGVAFVEEGERLVGSGITTPIVVLYPDTPERASRLVRAGLIATADSIEYLEAIDKAAKSLGKEAKYFLKVETGMGRFGIDAEDLDDFLIAARHFNHVRLIGVSTNLAGSAIANSEFSKAQYSEFAGIMAKFGQSISDMRTSIENSGGLIYSHDSRFDLVRVGIMLYGVSPNGQPIDGFAPVMSLKSRIVHIKKWPAGKPLGYGGTFAPERNSLIATVPIGYADGIPWALSNKGSVLVRSSRAPIVGRVCMDAIMIDVTKIPVVRVGDEVVIIGRQGDKQITVEEISAIAGSFPYELLTRMSERLPRIIKK